MTNAFQPLSGLPGFGGGTAPMQGLPGFSAPPPAAPQAVQQPGALPPALGGATLEQFDAARPVSDAGMLETVGTQAARGLLDAVLGSGALVGAGAESLGTVTGWTGLKDFGRDLGRSSSGTAAMEAAAFLFGGGGKEGLSYADRVERAVEEQERAWPMLSAVSRIGGAVGLGLATGAGAAGSLRGAAAIGAYEGAGAGASAAYERNEALRDVVVSALAGAALGGGGGAAGYGLTKVPGAIGKAVDERNLMTQVFGDVKTAADDVAEAVREAGGREVYDAAKAVLKERAAVLREAAAAGDNPSLIRQAYDRATHAAGERISKLAGDYDPGAWATKTPGPLQKLVHRTPILDRVSADVADDAARLGAARPSLDFDAKVPSKLLKNIDRPAAIAGLQNRVTGVIESMPDPAMGVAGAPALRQQLLDASTVLQTADAPGAFAAAHRLVRDLSDVAKTAQDPVTASFARRQAQAIADELGGERWGEAGKLYKTMTRSDTQLGALDAKAIREALASADASRAIPGLFAEEAEQTLQAFAAAKQLGGSYADEATRKLLKDLPGRAEKAHAAVTFDGAPARRVLEVLAGAGRNIGESYASDLLGMGVGMAVGGLPGMLVARALSPVLGNVASAAFGKGISAAGNKAGRQFARETVKRLSGGVSNAVKATTMDAYKSRLDSLTGLVASTSPDEAQRRERVLASLPPELQGMAGTDMQAKLTQLLADMPKPEPNIRGEEFEMLSREDLRRANAMWEATVEPLSVFDDFAAGSIDYDKVQYAWKQWPGLKMAAQAGLGDIIEQQLSKEDRKGISDGILTQLDNLFGFEGALQPTLDHGFSSRIDALVAASAQQQPSRPSPGGKLQLPGSQPSFTERLSGQRG